MFLTGKNIFLTGKQAFEAGKRRVVSVCLVLVDNSFLLCDSEIAKNLYNMSFFLFLRFLQRHLLKPSIFSRFWRIASRRPFLWAQNSFSTHTPGIFYAQKLIFLRIAFFRAFYTAKKFDKTDTIWT